MPEALDHRNVVARVTRHIVKCGMTSPTWQKLDRLRTKPPFLTPPGRRISADNPDSVLSHGQTGLSVLAKREKD